MAADDPSLDDENEQEQDDEEEVAAPAPVNPNDKEALKAQMLASLSRKFASPDYGKLADQTRGANDALAKNMLYAQLAKSSAMAGSVAGQKPIDSGNLGEMAGGLYKSDMGDINAQYMAANAQNKDLTAQSKYDTARSRLYNSLKDKTTGRVNILKGVGDPKDPSSYAYQDPSDPTKVLQGKLPGNMQYTPKPEKVPVDNSDKDAKYVDSEFNKFTDRIKGTMRDALGSEKAKLRVATHGLDLIANRDPNSLSNLEVQELGGVLASQVTQGSPAESTLRHMTANTMQGDLAKAYQYLTGNPEPTNQGAIVNLYRDILNRQIKTSSDIMQGELGPLVANYNHLRTKDPERFDRILKSAGITMGDQGAITAYQPSYIQSRTQGAVPPAPGAGPGTALAAPAGQAPGAAPPLTKAQVAAEIARRQAAKQGGPGVDGGD